MLDKSRFSPKKLLIAKDNTTISIIIGLASFVTIFSLVACKSLLSQSAYQGRVINAQKKAQKQLKANVDSVNKLKNSYEDFTSTSENVLGQSTIGVNGALANADNGRIVLDALPSKYDFPALTTSLEKILKNGGYTIESINGIDNEATATQSSGTPAPVEMPFQLTTSGNFDSIKALTDTFQRSIRPFVITNFELSGSDNKLKIALSAKTYYQPEKIVENKTKVIK